MVSSRLLVDVCTPANVLLLYYKQQLHMLPSAQIQAGFKEL